MSRATSEMEVSLWEDRGEVQADQSSRATSQMVEVGLWEDRGEVQADQSSRATSQMLEVSLWGDRGPVAGVDPVVLADQESLS